ncbi:phosphatase PAP2 family protein [Streptomyces nodosus]|uniref:phosphatase PAP2 family protein n=1 Tax=Streptomyces nodosus TaxID=40318 RepID=UPI003F50DDA2
MRDTPRPQGTAGDPGPRPPQLRLGRALAHTPGALRSGYPHRSDGRTPQTPRGGRYTDPCDRPGTTPPVPGRSAFPLLGSLLVLFLLITWQVVVHGPLTRADERLSNALFRPDRLSALLADLGAVAVAVPVLAVALFWAATSARNSGREGWWLPPVAAAVTMTTVPALVLPFKVLIARPGPPVMGPATGFYPSGHMATAMVAYGAAALVLWPWQRTPQARRALLTVCLALNLAVASGLIRSGYHWPLDVLGSWCLCGAMLCALWQVLNHVDHFPPPNRPT